MAPNTPSTVPNRPPLSQSRLRKALMPPRGPVPRLVVEPELASTNTWLVNAVKAEPEQWPDLSFVTTDNQIEGKGRDGRTWQTPPCTSVTVSIVLRPADIPVQRWTWLSMLAAVAVRRALYQRCGVAAELKWPNDVVVRDNGAPNLDDWGQYRKIAGLLSEVVTDSNGTPFAVVVGIGINALQASDELPVPWATSLALLQGRTTDRETILKACVRTLAGEYDAWLDTNGDAAACGLADAVRRNTAFLGSPVYAQLPSGECITGEARTIDDDGALVIVDADGAEHVVVAGDVHRVRLEL